MHEGRAVDHAMTVGAEDGEVRSRIKFNDLPLKFSDRREVMGLNEILADGTVGRFKVKATRFAFVAMNKLRLMGELSIAFDPLVFPEGQQVLNS